MNKIHGVLFDLDGTLFDTAPDLLFALNQLRQEYHLPELPLAGMRATVSFGAAAIIKKGFGLDTNHPDYQAIREKYLALYEKHLADYTQPFPKIESVIMHLNDHAIPWGIVTNRMTKLTLALLDKIKWAYQPNCIVCGDTLTKSKPHPEPLLEACARLNILPKHTLYVGDAATDVKASKAAGIKSLVALYGYIGADENPEQWQADGYINEPIEIIEWLEQYPQNR